MYARIENGQIKEYSETLPETLDNITNPTLEMCLAKGWRQVVKINDSYNPATQTLSEPFIQILPDKVVLTYVVSNKEIDVAAQEEIAKATVRNAILFGKNLMVEFSASQSVAALNTQQTYDMIQALAPIKNLLETGALETATFFIAQLPETGAITPEVKQSFIDKINAFLNQ